MSVASAPGWYGKLPALGDFASRRLPDEFVRGWDDWLQQGLAAARETLGTHWLAHYLVAPIVRFWLAPGVLGAPAWTGLVMPSVDRVGRHFPLVVVQPAGALASALAAHAWFGAVDGAARRVLDLACGVDDFEAALAAVDADAAPPATATVADRGTAWWCEDAVGHCRRYAALPPPRSLAALLVARETA